MKIAYVFLALSMLMAAPSAMFGRGGFGAGFGAGLAGGVVGSALVNHAYGDGYYGGRYYDGDYYVEGDTEALRAERAKNAHLQRELAKRDHAARMAEIEAEGQDEDMAAVPVKKAQQYRTSAAPKKARVTAADVADESPENLG